MAKSKLVALKEKYGFTQSALAKLIFVEQSTISKYESRKRRMNDEMIRRVINALGAAPDEAKELREEQGSITITENNDTANSNDFVKDQQYYYVPKQILDSIVQQQDVITNILQVLTEKLK